MVSNTHCKLLSAPEGEFLVKVMKEPILQQFKSKQEYESSL